MAERIHQKETFAKAKEAKIHVILYVMIVTSGRPFKERIGLASFGTMEP